jgi:hypothetical protein
MMSGQLRYRFWIEAILAALSASLFTLTLISPAWIEAGFRVDPDGGDGSVEWIISGLFLLMTLTFVVRARVEWRRARPHKPHVT